MSMYYFQVRFVRGLHRREFTLLKELAAFADDNDVAWPSLDALAGCTGYCPKSVDDGLKVLEKLKLIVIKITGHKTDAGLFVEDGRRYYLQRPEIDRYIRKDLDQSKAHSVEVSPDDLSKQGIAIVPGKRKKSKSPRGAPKPLPDAGRDFQEYGNSFSTFQKSIRRNFWKAAKASVKTKHYKQGSNTLTHDHTKGRSLHCRLASPIDPEMKGRLCPIFLDFVKRFCFQLDFRSYSETQRWYSRLKVPSSRIPDSLVSALVSRNETHEHWVKPSSNRITDRHHVLALGTIDKDDEFEGLMHLRIVKGDEAFIWVATHTPLNSTESIEATMWLRAASGLTLLRRTPMV